VAFSALVTAKAQGVRNTFNTKVADFVVCTKAMKVVAVVELDDRSHVGRELEDFNRDWTLKLAGLRVLRYPNIPDAAKLRDDFARL